MLISNINRIIIMGDPDDNSQIASKMESSDYMELMQSRYGIIIGNVQQKEDGLFLETTSLDIHNIKKALEGTSKKYPDAVIIYAYAIDSYNGLLSEDMINSIPISGIIAISKGETVENIFVYSKHNEKNLTKKNFLRDLMQEFNIHNIDYDSIKSLICK